LGNGLRVVAGAVAAGRGSVEVWTRGRHLVLTPRDADGGTDVMAEPAPEHTVGTRVVIDLGGLPHDPDPLLWAENAILMAVGATYSGRTSPHWYTADAFFELLQAAGDRYVRELIAEFDGCTGAKAGKIAAAFKGRACRAMTRDEARALLKAAKAEARAVKPERLGGVGAEAGPYAHYARVSGTIRHATHTDWAEVPYVVEAWAAAARGEGATIDVYVNRTPITGDVGATHWSKHLSVQGCGLRVYPDTGRADYRIALNITTPYMPLTSDGKEPDLTGFGPAVEQVVGKAVRRARRRLTADQPDEPETKRSHKAVVLARLAEGVAHAGGDGSYLFSQRQLFYVLRPFVKEESDRELTWDNFTGIITDHEAEHGEIAGMFRDPRGTLYHPHRGDSLALGTLAVAAYDRPPWLFNKLLYAEKEGHFEMLKAAGWPERHDCALVTSKGFSTRAARDLIDLLAAGDEPITVCCIHDADASGTMIYQTLQEETRARPRRRIEIVNLGLEPWEALAMGLPEEEVPESDRDRPVAAYARRAGWAGWLQRHRIELNALTSPRFIAWLDAKMAPHEGKVVPPAAALRGILRNEVEERLRTAKEAAILREARARVDREVEAALDAIAWPTDAALTRRVEAWLGENPEDLWKRPIDATAAALIPATEDRS
jgi:hypothetical protein